MLDRLRPLVPLLVAAALLALFYSWTASAGLPFGFGETHDGLYNLQAQALARGQLHLAIEPPRELFELSDPYDPGKNAPFRLHDASLYHGRYYLYFGIVPVLVAFLPWRLVGLGDLPEPAAALAFGIGGFIFSALLLRRLLVRHLPGVSGSVQALVYLALGLCNVVPFVLRGAEVYEVAITAGAFFAAGAAWCFVTGADAGGLGRLALGGMLLGLAVGSRANDVFLLPVLPLLAWAPGAPWRSRSLLRAGLAVAAPLAACLLALAFYNLLRFDAWTEFGARFQLMGGRSVPRFDYRSIAPTLFLQLLSPPELRLDFPFVFPYFVWKGSLPDGYFVDPWTTGALAHSPFLLILIGAPWILRRASAEQGPWLRWRLGVLPAAGLALLLATGYAFGSAAMRFQVDFVPFLLVPALVLWVALGRGQRRRWLFGAVAAGAFGWSALAAVALSLHGASDDLRRDNPALFAALERRFEPVRVALGRVLDRDGRAVLRLRAAFPERLAADKEPLLSWGSLAAYDALWVGETEPGVFTFSLDTAVTREAGTRPGPATRGLPLAPGRFYDLVFDLDRVRRRVRATVDGEAAFELPGRLVALHPNRLWPGRGPKGHGAPDLGQFSGSLVTEAMLVAGPPGLESLPPIAATPAVLVEAREALPAAAAPGQLGIVAGRSGAWLFAGSSWRWIPRAFVDRVRRERPLALLPGTAGTIVPILVSGDASGADAVVVRAIGPGRAAVTVARWKGAWELGPSAAVMATAGDRARVLAVTLDRPARSVVVTLDGREVLQASVELRPLECDSLFVENTPPGLAFGRETVRSGPQLAAP